LAAVLLEISPSRLEPAAGVDAAAQHDGVVLKRRGSNPGVADVDVGAGPAELVADRLGDLCS
jgi:hypothetical protein